MILFIEWWLNKITFNWLHLPVILGFAVFYIPVNAGVSIKLGHYIYCTHDWANSSGLAIMWTVVILIILSGFFVSLKYLTDLKNRLPSPVPKKIEITEVDDNF